MKRLIIFVLSVALLAAAFFTRPTQEDFNRYVSERKAGGQTNILKAGWDQLQAEQFTKSCTFNDHFLWVDVQRNGKTIYTGAFAHWFSHAQVAGDVNAVKQQIDNVRANGK